MPTNDNSDTSQAPQGVEEEAARAFLRRQEGEWTALDQADLEAWLADPACAKAYQKVSATWRILGDQATSPELIALRGQALARARVADSERFSRRHLLSHWKWAAAAVVVVTIGLIPRIFVDNVSEAAYATGIGEQRIIELEDRSRIALDALTTLRVRLTRDSRVIELAQGQAQFMVASDPRRPFRVEAGEHTITAVGTSFNVDFLDKYMQVAMVEGKVAVSVAVPSGASGGVSGKGLSPAFVHRTIDLIEGQELRVEPDGRALLVPEADIAAAIAWRQGIVILKDTLLSDAVRELNRHSRLQIRIGDPALGALRVSGVFESRDTQGFLEAVQSFLPVIAAQESPDLVRLSPVRESD